MIGSERHFMTSNTRLILWGAFSLVAVSSEMAFSAQAKPAKKHEKDVPAETDQDTANGESVNLLAFRGSLNAAYQTTGGYSITPGASWNPVFHVSNNFGLVGHLGLVEYNTEIDTHFTAIEYGLLAAIKLGESISGELGGGAQYWTGDGGNVNSLTLSANIIFNSSPSNSGHLRPFIGYSGVMVPKMFTHVFRVGIAL